MRDEHARPPARQTCSAGWPAAEPRRLPIETVTLKPGYASPAAFSCSFKRVTGMSPGASRQVVRRT
ncbi:hypothetical protein CFB46_21350 [Burkholderia sp. HI2761]|nr:hypothetical protein CFB46_21350 [Burkholderia sp. HI2761]